MCRINEPDRRSLDSDGIVASPKSASNDKKVPESCGPDQRNAEKKTPLNEIRSLTVREALEYLNELPDGTMLEVIIDEE